MERKIKRYSPQWNPKIFVEIEVVVMDELVHRRIVNTNFHEFGLTIDPRVHKLLEIGYMKQRSKKWKLSRQEKITASKVAAIIGHNVKCTREMAFDAEVGKIPAFKGNRFTQHGIIYEPVALTRYMQVTKKIGLKFGLIPHPVYDYIGGSPDLITLDGILIEVKCPFYRKAERIAAVSRGEVPEMYMPQIQLVLEITGLDEAHYVEYYPSFVKAANAPRNAPPEKEEIFVVSVKKDPDWFKRHFPTIEAYHKELVVFGNLKKDYTARIIQNLFRFHKTKKYSALLKMLYYKTKLMRHMGKKPKAKPTESEMKLKSFMTVNI